MKVLMINVVCGIRSTGRICTDLAQELEAQGHEVKIAYGREDVPEQFKKYAVRIGTDFDVKLHGVKSRLFDTSGFGSKRATKKFIEWVKEYNPDVIHLHNIHGYYINIEILFGYLHSCKKKIIWTLHDCWAFTGHCAYFTAAGCDNWKTQCKSCLQLKSYPSCNFRGNVEENFRRKKIAFTGVKGMTLITPSKWLAGLVRESFLKEYSVKVINNGIDTGMFKPTPSDFRKRYNLEGKKIILGVASVWDKRKGLDDFVKLSKILDDNYKIVLVGLSERQIREIPDNIIKISRTNSVNELAEIYTAANVFVNPTYEDNYPTTNLEAIACGTPVITYDTGGSPESAIYYGTVVQQGDFDVIVKAIKKNHNINFDYKHTVIDLKMMINEYLKLVLND